MKRCNPRPGPTTTNAPPGGDALCRLKLLGFVDGYIHTASYSFSRRRGRYTLKAERSAVPRGRQENIRAVSTRGGLKVLLR